MILAYRGTSLLSWWIRIRTWSDHSHISHLLRDGTEIEAWQGGVQHNKEWGILHTAGTMVDVYQYVNPITGDQIDKIECFLESQIGKPYDYLGLFRFLPIVRLFTKTNAETDRWFCSELEATAQQAGGVQLIDKESYKVTPEDVACSPVLKKVDTWIVGCRSTTKKLDMTKLSGNIIN